MKDARGSYIRTPRIIQKYKMAVRKRYANGEKLGFQKNHPRFTTYSFPRGIPAWNKGLNKRLNTGRTHFKKGAPSWNAGIKGYHIHTEESRRKLSEINSLDKHPQWQGGKSFEQYPPDWKETLKESIRQRDSYKCKKCGVPKEECIRNLDVHHIDCDKKNLDPKNLVTLCASCHQKIHSAYRINLI